MLSSSSPQGRARQGASGGETVGKRQPKGSSTKVSGEACSSAGLQVKIDRSRAGIWGNVKSVLERKSPNLEEVKEKELRSGRLLTGYKSSS